MIYVDRSAVKEPDILSNPKGRGAKELADVIDHYVTKGNTTPYKKFKVYQDRSVKDALIQLFRGKCAYCESHCLHVYSGDIEHFRPKGAIQEALPDPQPGYFWLAAKWDNLLFSCRNCNQKLKHKVWGQKDLRTMGKMDQFPTENDYWVRTHLPADGIKVEEPYRLLLNPCIDQPEDHLVYDEWSGVISPKKGSKKGKKSIEVYVLQRVLLVQQREKYLIEIHAQIQRVREALETLDHFVATNDQLKIIKYDQILKREIDRLKRFLEPGNEYVGMARQVISKYVAELGIKL